MPGSRATPISRGAGGTCDEQGGEAGLELFRASRFRLTFIRNDSMIE